MNSTAGVVRTSPRQAEETAPRVHSVPAALKGHVWHEGDRLKISGQPLPAFTLVGQTVVQMGFLGALMLSVLAILAGALLPSIPVVVLGLLGTLFFAACAIVTGLSHLFWFATGTTAVVGPQGYRMTLPGSRLRSPSPLRLQGEVGQPLRIIGDHGILFEQRPRVRGPWQVAHIFWLAREMAEHMGMTLELDLDVDKWKRWAVDSAFRARIAFESKIAQSRAKYASWYRIPPAEPAKVRFESDHLRWGNLMLERRGLRSRRHGIVWDHLLNADVELYEYAWTDANGTYHQSTRARLIVQTTEGVKEVTSGTDATPQSIAELFWARDQVLQHAGSSVNLGTRDEVPAELLAARTM